MISDKALANHWVAPECDGDIGLGTGGTWEFRAIGQYRAH